MTEIFVYIIPVIALLAFLLVFFGESIVGLLGAVKRFRSARAMCMHWALNGSVAGKQVHDLFQMRLEEVGAPPPAMSSDPAVKDLRFGDIAVIVHYKEKHLKHCTREVGFYAGVSLAVLIVAGLWFARGASDPKAVLYLLAENHLVPILELVMLFLWLIRLGSEVRSIDSLFEH